MIKSLPSEQVCEVFYLLSGKEGDCSLLCASAADAILARVKKSARAERWLKPLCYAAGALAYYRYSLSHELDNTSVYKAGDIQIKSDAHLPALNAEKLLRDALDAVSPVLCGEFAFMVV